MLAWRFANMQSHVSVLYQANLCPTWGRTTTEVVNLKKMREKRIQQWVKWWLLRPSNFYFLALLLRPSNLTTGKVQLCDLTPQCFLICDRRDRGVDSMLYTVHATKHGRKRRDVAIFYSFNQSINQSGSFGSIALATPSTMVPTMPKTIFHLATHCGCP